MSQVELKDLIAIEVMKKCMDRKKKDKITHEVIESIVFTSYQIAKKMIEEKNIP